MFCALFSITACDAPTTEELPNPPVVRVESGDPEWSAAVRRAKDTFWFFEQNWQTLENDGYSVKFALQNTAGELEHIWFSPTRIAGDSITGECANDPRDIPGLKFGDSRTVTRDQISDWMIVVGNKCYGGYTIRVAADRQKGSAPDFEFVDPQLD